MDDFSLLEQLFPAEALEEAKGPGPGPEPGPEIFTVSGFLAECQGAISSRVPLAWVQGEVSNLRVPSSGHFYFTLKDERAQLRAVMFKGRADALPFTIEEGMELVCFGEANIYQPRGELQLVVERAEPKGEGALRIAFEQLKRKLQEEGLFDEEHKRSLPLLPGRVFLITSPTGAAMRDFLKTARNLGASGEVVLCPVQVQGDAAPAQLCEMLMLADSLAVDGDVIVLTRGGGSIEDLWPFNDEGLARAIHAARTAVVSAVGHEIDFTIADFVSDVRAATPTAAAHVVFGAARELADSIAVLGERLSAAMTRVISEARSRFLQRFYRLRGPQDLVNERRIFVDDLTRRMDSVLFSEMGRFRLLLQSVGARLDRSGPERRILEERHRLDGLVSKLHTVADRFVETREARFSRACALLESASPLAILARGYSMVFTEDGAVVRDAGAVEPGDGLTIRPMKGRIRCKVVSREE